MLNDRTLEADIEYAAELVREGLATTEQAAHACGIPTATLLAHLNGAPVSEPQQHANAPQPLRGSEAISHPGEDPPDSRERRTPQSSAADSEVETTDYFVFYREEDRWIWKRVDCDGNIVKASASRFPLYLDCVADARPHGFKGRPLFIFAASDIAALNAPDKPR